MRKTDKYVFFWNDPFSNFEFVNIEHKGHKFPTTEHAYMWEKAIFFGDTKIAEEILTTDKPGLAKNLGRQVKGFDQEKWEEVAYDIMLEINRHKWRDTEKYSSMLLETGDRKLVEASPYDRVWGIGMGENDEGVEDESNWTGHNLLGKVIMQIREELN